MYNLFMTGAPPIAIGLFDQSCSVKSRMDFPSLYKTPQKSALFNNKVFWRWIALAVFHSLILYGLPAATFHFGLVWDNGKNGDYLVLGNIVYSCVEVTVCLKAALILDSWNWLTHLSIWGSIAFWFLFLIVYSFFWVIGLPLAANMAGIIILIGQTPMFWLSVLLVPFTALIPDIFGKAVFTSARPNETDLVRIAEIMHRNVGTYVEDLPKQKKLDRIKQETVALFNSAAIRANRAIGRRKSGGQENSAEMTRQTSAHAGANLGSQLGYAFDQDEGGVISQSQASKMYGAEPKIRNRSGVGSGGGGKRYDQQDSSNIGAGMS
jgi:phospholipid-transporting ATPase